MAALPEIIVICIDNSSWMNPGSPKFKAQCDAIKMYCQAKFEAHPETVVSLYTMSSEKYCHLVYPATRSLEKIIAKFPFIRPGYGELDLLRTLSVGRLPFVKWLRCPNKQLRMLFFIGGFTNLSSRYVELYGKAFKETGIAVEVVNFHQGKVPILSRSAYRCGRNELEAFVKACNRNDNSRIVHVERPSLIVDVLSKSILKETLALALARKEINVNDKAAAAAHDEAQGTGHGNHVERPKGKLINGIVYARHIHLSGGQVHLIADYEAESVEALSKKK